MSKKDPFDFSDMFAGFDPAEATRRFQEMFENSPFSRFNDEDLAETQRKNFEAMLNAQKVAMEGARSIIESQAEMLQKALAEAAETIQKMAAGKPEDIPEQNAEAVEKAFNQSVENFNELTAMVESLYADLSEKVEERVRENLETLKETLAKATEEASKSGDRS